MLKLGREQNTVRDIRQITGSALARHLGDIAKSATQTIRIHTEMKLCQG